VKIKLLLVFLITGLIIELIILSYSENGIKLDLAYKASYIQDFHLTYKDGDKMRWELVSEKAIFPKEGKEVILKGLTMLIHNKDKITLTGGSGIYNIQNENLVVGSPVEIDIRGTKLITDSLTWDVRGELITTSDAVRFRGGNFLIEGKGLTASIKDQRIKILGDVKSTFYR